jgi:tryptophan-rich sensory protein
MNWYNTLNKPPLTPPSVVFAPAWTILYILIFISLIIFLTTKTFEKKTFGIVLFVIQMALNLLWPQVFFYWHNMEFAFVIIILLVVFVLATIMQFYKVSKISAFLLIPYFLWLLFATYLNWGFLIVN